MIKKHLYKTTIEWTGNQGLGTANYRSYQRSHDIIIDGKPNISGSSDPDFLGDKTKHNPEDLFISSLSSCHMLWYLHLCAEAGIIVTEYIDRATGLMYEDSNGGGHFTEVTLNPTVTITDSEMIGRANELHQKANELCFIANSVNFPVHHYPTTITKKH